MKSNPMDPVSSRAISQSQVTPRHPIDLFFEEVRSLDQQGKHSLPVKDLWDPWDKKNIPNKAP